MPKGDPERLRLDRAANRLDHADVVILAATYPIEALLLDLTN